MSTPTNPLSRPVSAPAGTPGRPALPKRLMFSSKSIIGRAVPEELSLGASNEGKAQIALPFVIAEGKPDQNGKATEQRAFIYAIPDDYTAAEIGKNGPIPVGTRVYMIATITPDSLPYVVEKLQNAGWTGNSFRALKAGQYDGLGAIDCRLNISIKETKPGPDGKNIWLTDEKGNFRPQMEVNFVNKLAGAFTFKNEASDDLLGSLDAMMGSSPSGNQPQHRATSTAPTPTVPSASLPPVPEVSDEDIPF